MKQKTLLITGATGFLGGYLTQELLQAGFRLKLLVRKTLYAGVERRISEVFPRCTGENAIKPVGIEIIEGDVSQKYLGIPVTDYLRLAQSVDEVFHCAAATKFTTGETSTFIGTNIFGTMHVAQFCSAGKRKRFHYISTAYVAGKRRDVVMENELEKGQSFNNEYERSKYLAERNLYTYARENNIPYTVYRPSIITGDTATGYTKNYDNIYAFGRALILLRDYEIRRFSESDQIHINRKNYLTSVRVPGDKHSTINLIPVDYAARAIVTISRHEESINSTFHIVNPSPPTIAELAEWMKESTGVNTVSVVPLQEFETRPSTLQERLFLRDTRVFQPYLFGEPYFDSTNTKNLLAGTGIECPMITGDMVALFMRYAIDTNWGRKLRNAGGAYYERETMDTG